MNIIDIKGGPLPIPPNNPNPVEGGSKREKIKRFVEYIFKSKQEKKEIELKRKLEKTFGDMKPGCRRGDRVSKEDEGFWTRLTENINSLEEESTKTSFSGIVDDKTLDQDKTFTDALKALDELRNKLDETPFIGPRPSLSTNRGQTLLGLPLDHVRQMIGRAIEENKHPRHIFKKLGEKYGVGNGMTRYEYTSLFVQSLRVLKANFDAVEKLFKEDENQGEEYFYWLTSLRIHTDLNDWRGLLPQLKALLNNFEKEYNKCKDDDQRLKLFTTVFHHHEACVPARVRYFEENLPKLSEDPNVKYQVHYNEKSPLEKIFNEEYQVMSQKRKDQNIKDDITQQEFLDYLTKKRKITELKGIPKGETDPRLITQGDIKDWIQYATDILMLFDDEDE